MSCGVHTLLVSMGESGRLWPNPLVWHHWVTWILCESFWTFFFFYLRCLQCNSIYFEIYIHGALLHFVHYSKFDYMIFIAHLQFCSGPEIVSFHNCSFMGCSPKILLPMWHSVALICQASGMFLYFSNLLLVETSNFQVCKSYRCIPNRKVRCFPFTVAWICSNRLKPFLLLF